ncbi:MAG: hypothetical protein ACR2KJ_07900 [Jatrophihabitans sp.]
MGNQDSADQTGNGGAHYTSSRALPMIAGIDAVGQRAEGSRIYFVAMTM